MCTSTSDEKATWSHEPVRVDPEETRATLQGWLRERRGTDVEVLEMRTPTENGGTGDNLLLTLREGAGEGRIVVRLDPFDLSHIHEVSIALHHRVLETLDPTPVPVPHPLWLETDSSVLGVPFMAMDFVAGRAPSDFPLYNEAGFLFEATPQYQHRLWTNALDALVLVHRVDPEPFGYLDRPDRGADGLDQHIAYLREAFDQAPVREDVPALLAALTWVERTRPPLTCPGLAWGDPRIGNILFDDDGAVTAMLDWDQASLAGPLADLGWWLLFDRLHAEDYSAPRLPGLGSREETISRWQEGTGLSADGVEWFEVLAGLRLTIVRYRGVKARELRGGWVPPADNPRSWQRLLARVESMIRTHP